MQGQLLLLLFIKRCVYFILLLALRRALYIVRSPRHKFSSHGSITRELEEAREREREVVVVKFLSKGEEEEEALLHDHFLSSLFFFGPGKEGI